MKNEQKRGWMDDIWRCSSCVRTFKRRQARVRQVKTRKELSEKRRYGERESGRGAERSTNLKEGISSGRVIK